MDGYGANNFKLDEGFSESEPENVRTTSAQTADNFQGWLMSQSEQVRAEIAYEILRTLRTSNIASVVDRLTPLLHMDPIEKLPPEITAEIFSYLDAQTLLTASLSSSTWRQRILDPRLWEQLYKSQGWGINEDEVRAFEEAHADITKAEVKKAEEQNRVRKIVKGQPLMKRRATSDWLVSSPRQISADVAQWREQHGTVEADTEMKTESDDQEMPDISTAIQDSPARPKKRASQDSGDEIDIHNHIRRRHKGSMDSTVSRFESGLLLDSDSGEGRLNWPYLFKQRQKLENNWMAGRFINFQLPHPSYPHEAHTECVYTIQFFGKWLVSGSRDKTLRIWDLETRRLRGRPLQGHTQSVLCLQFDPTEKEDIIISGSSDSSIIIWRFSTGQRIQTIPNAHEESVLNLRFDQRYLVTCSKDKKIKIWNRNELTPFNVNYPKLSGGSAGTAPSYVVNTDNMDLSLIEARLANGTIKALKPYTHLMTLHGHSAAVNAIQISGDLVVSASGDRLIRIWNVKTGECLRVIPGHSKGIACVQFDSKRIVSGSSDNSVRIYDPVTGTEVAVLTGHTNLVRTVQAGFGDAPGSDEEDVIAARTAEIKFQHDVESGAIVDDREYGRRLRNGEFGSSRIAFGSNLPPGGGGSRWGRIVSGSYDETIIIWKKDADGHWVVGRTLRQEDAVRATMNGETRSVQRTRRRSTNNAPPQTPVQSTQAGPSNAVVPAGTVSATQIVQSAVTASMAGLQSGLQNVMGFNRGANAPVNVNMNLSPRSSSSAMNINMSGLLGPTLQAATNQIASHTQAVTQNLVSQFIATGQANFTTNMTGTTSTTSQDTIMTHTQSQQDPMQQTNSFDSNHPPQQHEQQQQQQFPPPQPATAAHNNPNVSVSRVFKLQFDARRIVCCSQDSRIIGWDFANADPDIIESCRFFIGP